MFKFPSSLPTESFEKTVSLWFDSINLSTSTSILNLSERSQWHYVHQLLNNKTLLKRILGRINRIQFITIEMMSFPIDSPQEFYLYLQDTIKKDTKKAIFFILGAEILLSEKLELLHYLNELSLTDSKLRFILFFQTNITIPRISKQFSRYEIMYQNILPIPLHTNDDILHFINYEAGRYGITISRTITDSIVNQCGGRLYLAKQAVRYYTRTHDMIHLFSHKEMELAVQMVFNELEEEEKHVLSLITNGNQPEYEHNEIIEYLKTIRLINQINNKYTITIPLLEKYIKKIMIDHWTITFNKEKLMSINGVIVKGEFTKREHRLLNFIYVHRKTIVSRENIAKNLWSVEKKESYSDWALDMAISRLRNKLKQLGIHKELIITHRNKGFLFDVE